MSMTEIRDAAAQEGGTLWLDFDHTDEVGMALLGELMEVRPGDIQECHNRSPVPKMRFYADHHFSAINGLARGADGRLIKRWATKTTPTDPDAAIRELERAVALAPDALNAQFNLAVAYGASPTAVRRASPADSPLPCGR